MASLFCSDLHDIQALAGFSISVLAGISSIGCYAFWLGWLCWLRVVYSLRYYRGGVTQLTLFLAGSGYMQGQSQLVVTAGSWQGPGRVLALTGSLCETVALLGQQTPLFLD